MLGATGVWMGSFWLATEVYRRTMPGSGSMQTALVGVTSAAVRARSYTGKPARLLKTRWTDACAAPDAPEPLPMPLPTCWSPTSTTGSTP